MKKFLLIALPLVLIFGVSLSALAEGIKVDGGYLFGTYDVNNGFIKGDARGFLLSGEGAISGPVGLRLDALSLSCSNFKMGGIPVDASIDLTTLNVLGTYALPLKGVGLKLAAGYHTGTVNFTGVGRIALSGFLVGGYGEFSPMDRLTISGSVGLGLGVKGKPEGSPDYDELDVTLLQVSAAYKVAESVSVLGGYLSHTYTEKTSSQPQTMSGLFVGVQGRF